MRTCQLRHRADPSAPSGVGLTGSVLAFRGRAPHTGLMDARRMRVSDNERERVALFLREQSLEGRLDHDELDERMGAAYRAKTAGELQDLIEDLPHRRVAPAPARRPAPQRRRKGPHPLAIAGMCLLGLLVLPTLAAAGIGVVFAVVMALVVAVF